MGSQDLKLEFANWLTATGASASWDKAQSFLLTQVPWRDLPVQAMHSILTYPDMKVREGKTVSSTLAYFLYHRLSKHAGATRDGYNPPCLSGVPGQVQE